MVNECKMLLMLKTGRINVVMFIARQAALKIKIKDIFAIETYIRHISVNIFCLGNMIAFPLFVI